jgi:uncharacterized membrane protein
MKTPSLLLRWQLIIGGGLDGQILGLHHVHAGSGELAWDLRFLPFGELLIATGAAGASAGRDEVTQSGPVPGLTASQRPPAS